MTHFARADEPGHPLTREQLTAFRSATQGLAVETSLCNSAGLLAWPDAHGDWARPDIMLYGANPLADSGMATPVAIDGQASQIIGRVSMDMLTVDLTDLPDTGAGSEVELWGARVSVDTVAKHAGTIAYELLCNVKRVSFP